MKRDSSGRRDFLVKTCGFIVTGISIYLLAYFFILYPTGCEQLIKFWVLANLVISISFTGLRVFYIYLRKGREGVKKALSWKNQNSKSGMGSSTMESKKVTYKLGEDFFSIAFFSYQLM
jgi:hypothetical protein